MFSLLFRTATRFLFPLMILFSVFVLFRGHHAPGGGFIGGLVAAAAFAIYLIAYGAEQARAAMRMSRRLYMAIGLTLMLGSGLLSMLMGQPFLTTQWYSIEVPVLGKLGTPGIFDTGVYLAVIGVTLVILISLAESGDGVSSN